MSELLQLRCSGLPLAFRCPGAARGGALRIDDVHESADTGTAAHAGLARLVETGRVDWDAIPELARRHGCEEEELRILIALGAKLWEEVKESFPEPVTEQLLRYTLGPVTLTGHTDILSRVLRHAIIGDWKTGRRDSDYSEQLKGYAALALLEDGQLETATAYVLWVRDGAVEQYTMTRSKLREWLLHLETDLVHWDGTYRPGKQCQYCPRLHECPAGHALVRSAVAAIANQDVDDAKLLRDLPREQIIQLIEQADIVKGQAERIRAAARKLVEEQGDIVASGKRLTLEQVNQRRVDTLKAFPVLEERGFDDAALAEVIDISVKQAENIVAKRAGKGKGAAAVRELRAALEGANAIQIETITRLVMRREQS